MEKDGASHLDRDPESSPPRLRGSPRLRVESRCAKILVLLRVESRCAESSMRAIAGAKVDCSVAERIAGLRRSYDVPPAFSLHSHFVRIHRLSLATLALVAAPFRVASAQRASDSLEIGFRDPPASARPRTWWHWTQSNVTKEGITKDLEWMKRVGIAGFQLADVNAGGGQVVERKIVFGTPEWLDAVRHAAAEADRLGLEMDLFASPGWSLTGGPWVKPAQAMKKLVWSDTVVQGPRRVSMVLPHPPTNNGPIRNLARGGNASADPTFYGDDAVIAYRTPSAAPACVVTVGRSAATSRSSAGVR